MRRLTPRRSKRSQWMVAGAALLALGLQLAFEPEVRATPACMNPANRYATANDNVVLDASHPWAELRFNVAIDAEVVPAGMTADAVSASAVPSVDGRSFAEPYNGAPFPIEVYFVDPQSGLAMPRFGATPGNTDYIYDPSLPMVSVPFTPGRRLDRELRLAVVLAGSATASDRYSVNLEVRVVVTYPSSIAPCLPPWEGKLAVTRQPAAVGAVSDLRRAELPSVTLTGKLVARHITVAVDKAQGRQSTSVLRIVASRPTGPVPYPWHGWARLIADGDVRPTVEGPLGRWMGRLDNTLDAPVLDDCDPGRPCARGYWLLLAWMPYSPRWDGRAFVSDPPGSISWSAETMTWGPDGHEAGNISLVDDTSVDPLGALVTMETPLQTLSAGYPGASVDITLTTQRTAPVAGLDLNLAGIAIVPTSGAIESRYPPTLSGSGAPSMGRGVGITGYLIGHPLDTCTGVTQGSTCQSTFRLMVGASGAALDTIWALRLAAPPDTTVAISAPAALPVPSATPGPALFAPPAGFAAAAGVLVVLAVLALCLSAGLFVLRRRSVP